MIINKQKPTQLSGFIFGGPYGPKFELFSTTMQSIVLYFSFFIFVV